MICIGVGLQRCSFRLDGQCEKPQEVGRATVQSLHVFFVYVQFSEAVTEKEKGRILGRRRSHKRKENDGMNRLFKKFLKPNINKV